MLPIPPWVRDPEKRRIINEIEQIRLKELKLALKDPVSLGVFLVAGAFTEVPEDIKMHLCPSNKVLNKILEKYNTEYEEMRKMAGRRL